MSVKSDVLKKLEENRGKILSGQQLAEELWVTRAAVWKAIESLRADGYAIGSSRNRGYYLDEGNDLLSKEGIRLHLPKEYQDRPIVVYQTVDSTNSAAKRLAMQGEKHRSIITAEEQTAGRGRLGRSFYSPSWAGVYMSVILRPKRSLQDSLTLTVAAAVAVCRAVESLDGVHPEIKWVNDVFLNGRKLCGILTEAIIDFESGMAEAVIVGIGVNFKAREEDFPEELRTIATALNPEHLTRNELIARIAEELFRIADGQPDDLMEEYRRRSMVLGQEISFTLNGELQTGKVLEINEIGNLVVQTDQGLVVLRAGEVSIKKAQGDR